MFGSSAWVSVGLVAVMLAVGAEAFGPSLPLGIRRSAAAVRSTGPRMNVDSVESRLSEEQKGGPYKDAYAPMITLFDSVGCPRENNEYKGPKAGTLDDERCVVVEMGKVYWSENTARNVFYDILPLFNNAYSRAQVSQRIARLNGEAKAAGLPPNKWPFPPGYIPEKKESIYSIVPGGQKAE